jgi:hypothetical protein
VAVSHCCLFIISYEMVSGLSSPHMKQHITATYVTFWFICRAS